MNEKDVTRLREKLETLRRELTATEQLSRDAARPVELDQACVGRVSRMDAMQGQAMALETRRRRQEQLLLVDDALRRIDGGVYGLCLSCEEEIDPRRLEFNPAVPTCVACAGRRR